MKTVEFIKDHVYGGLTFKKGEKLELPDSRADLLVKSKAAKLPKAKADD
jgi:hypothetical protein